MMRIAVSALPQQQQEWNSRPIPGDIEVLWSDGTTPEADAYFDLSCDERGYAFAQVAGKPVFVNAVIKTLDQLPANASRLNAWNGFICRETIEVVLRDDSAGKLLEQLQWKYNEVPDITGMITPRVVSMIINEAYFALGDGVSTKEDIDTAMKLGTNYPYGPFEWSERIGLHQVYRLLRQLSLTDERYTPATALEQELKAIA